MLQHPSTVGDRVLRHHGESQGPEVFPVTTSSTQVFTGQTMSNNGGPSATTTRLVAIQDPPSPGQPAAPAAPITPISVPVTG
jgi:hypothetical protein